MNSFLHSEAWESFQLAAGHHPFRHEGQLYCAHTNRIASYIIGSRLLFTPESSLPTTYGKAFIRLEPEDQASLERITQLSKRPLQPTFSVQPRQTSIVQLATSEEEQLAGWSSKHRYNLRLAEKKEVVIETYSSAAPEQFERFWTLLNETAFRQQFRTHPQEYYRLMLETLTPLSQAHLLFATHQGQDLATLLLITSGSTATYLHGASSESHKELMAPFPLHLAAMQLAASLDCHTYDLWGTDATQNDQGRWVPKEGASSYGVTRFKLGFGGEVIQFPGAFDVVLDPIRYSAYKTLRILRGGSRSFS